MLETLEERIMRHEGFCSFPKIDVPPMFCVGFGHDITEQSAKNDYPNGISTEDAIKLLDEDISAAKLAVARELPWTLGLSEIKQEVLVEMCFQMGINGLLQFKNMLSCARDGDDSGVVKSMLASKWHTQTPARCEELANLWINQGEEL